MEPGLHSACRLAKAQPNVGERHEAFCREIHDTLAQSGAATGIAIYIACHQGAWHDSTFMPAVTRFYTVLSPSAGASYRIYVAREADKDVHQVEQLRSATCAGLHMQRIGPRWAGCAHRIELASRT